MSQRYPLYVMNVSKTFFVWYKCLKDIFCTLWMSQRHLLYVMNVSKTSFVRYECIKDIFCTLWMYVMNVSKTSFVRYECLYSVSEKNGTLWVTVSRLYRFSAHILLTSTQNVLFYSGHTVHRITTYKPWTSFIYLLFIWALSTKYRYHGVP